MPRDGTEIEPLETEVRRKRATISASPISGASASESISLDESSVRKRRASSALTPNREPPGVSQIEIGSSETKVRRKRASILSKSMLQTPVSEPISSVEIPTRKHRANKLATPRRRPPGVSPIGHDSNAVVGGDGRAKCDVQLSHAIPAIVNELVSLQKMRRFSITERMRSERAIESMIASTMGFMIDADTKERKAVFARAKAFRLSVEKGSEGHRGTDTQKTDALTAITPLILISAAARKPYADQQKKTEAEMATHAAMLPSAVIAFARSVNGFGKTTLQPLAYLVAEAGIPIGDYRTVSGLWKRMGVAVINGERQRRVKNKEDALIHGYSPRRRAELWSICSDVMFRQQWMGDRDEDGARPAVSGKPVAVPAHAIGHYGEVYGRRRAATRWRVAATGNLPTSDPEKWTDGRCLNDAKRIMSKALLRDIWRVWRGLPPRGLADIE